MNTFRLQLRFLIPLLLTLGVAAYLALPLMDSLTLRWFSRDLNSRGELLTNALSDSIAEALADPNRGRLVPLFTRAAKDERLIAIGLCSRGGKLLAHTENYPSGLTCDAARLSAIPDSPIIQIPGGAAHIGVHAVVDDTGQPIADLVLLHDLSFIARRSEDTRRYLIFLIAALGGVIALITVVVAQLSWRGWVSGAQALLRGEGLIRPIAPSGELAPFAADLRSRLRDLEDEYRRSLELETGWNAERLRGAAPHPAARRRDHGRLESRAVHPRPRGRRHDRRAPAGERPRDGGRAGDARLLGNLDRARQRQRRPRDGQRPRPAARPSGRRRLHVAPALAHAPRKSRATTTASPTKGCGRFATSPTCGRCSARAIGTPTAPSTSASPTRSSTRRAARTRSSWCRTTTSPCCRR